MLSPCWVGHRDQLIGGRWKLNMNQYTNLTGIRDVPCLDRPTTIIYYWSILPCHCLRPITFSSSVMINL